MNPRFKLHFTRETLAELARMKAANPRFTKREAYKHLGVTETTLNKAAARSGLRDELNKLFPRHVLNGNESAKPKCDTASLWACMGSRQVQWLTGNWAKGE